MTLVEDPVVFAARVQDWLTTEPLTANVLAVELAGVLDGTRSTMPGSVWAVVTGSGGRVVGAAMHTHPRGVFVPRLPPGAAGALAAAFARVDRVPAGASGELVAVGAFATAWERLTGSQHRHSRATRLHRLGQLVPPTGVPGTVRTAGAGDVDLVRDWFRLFARENGEGHADPAEEAGAATRKVANGEVRIWAVGDRPVSLASVSDPAVGVSRIGPVFTPRPERGHGFAAAVTAAASTAALAAGAAEVVLYTDLANPTAGRVYRRIGFIAEFDAAEVTLVAGALRAPLLPPPGPPPGAAPSGEP